ncbi:ABC transporter ATP-binding protein [soil metagenome]
MPAGVLSSFKPHKAAIIASVAAMIGDSIVTALRPWPLKVVIDSVISHRRTRVPIVGPWVNGSHFDRIQILYLCCGASLLIALITGLLTYYYTMAMGEIAQRSTFSLRGSLFAHLQRLSLLFHDTQRTGDLLARLTTDVGSIQDVISSDLITLITNAALLIAMLAIMFWLNWQFALVALAAAPFLFWTVFSHTKRIKLLAQATRKSNGLLASLAQETLTSIRIIQGLAQESHQDERYRVQGEESLALSVEGLKYRARVAPLVDFMAAIGLVSVMYYGTIQVLAGRLSTGDVIIFFAYVTNLYAPIRALSKLTSNFAKASIGMQRINEILDVSPHVTSGTTLVHKSTLRGELKFDHVSFSYPESPELLHDLNFTIAPGEKVAIVGATGAGKTTLASFVPRLFQPSSGKVLLDGHDLRDLEVSSLRENISLVLQESLLFSGTIRENIAFGKPNASFEEIQQAAIAANAHEFILGKRNQYDTYVSERGNSLSGGQKQRVAIARAILRDAPILIMDEPTSGLDAIAEQAVMQSLEAAAEGRTAIIIAHRLNTIRFVDRILILQDGQIVEEGTHDELMRMYGTYSHFYRIQFGEDKEKAMTAGEALQ